jgi:hypothetical protein
LIAPPLAGVTDFQKGSIRRMPYEENGAQNDALFNFLIWPQDILKLHWISERHSGDGGLGTKGVRD